MGREAGDEVSSSVSARPSAGSMSRDGQGRSSAASMLLSALLAAGAGMCWGGTWQFVQAKNRVLNLTWLRSVIPDHWLPAAGAVVCLLAWGLLSHFQQRRPGESLAKLWRHNALACCWLYLTVLINLQDRWFAGDIGDILLVGGLAMTALSLGAGWRTSGGGCISERIKAWWPVHKAMLVAAASLLLSLLYSLEWLGPRPVVSGDEPSYLMIAGSIARDFDVSMDNNYRLKEYRRFGVETYPVFTHLGKDHANYPHHSIGLPIYLAVWLRLLPGWAPWPLVFSLRLAVALIAAFLFAQVYLLTRDLFPEALQAWPGVIVGLSTAPLLFYSSEIYPELGAALAAVVAVRMWLRPPRLRTAALAGLAIGVLPWLGIKYFTMLAALLLLWAYRLASRRAWRACAGFALPLALSAAFYLTFLYRLYGNFSPNSIYHGVQPDKGVAGGIAADAAVLTGNLGFRLQCLSDLLAGVWLEQRMGLLFLAPVYLLLFPGIAAAWRTGRKRALALLLPAFAHLFIYGYDNNWGGYCPSNRPSAAALPLLLPLLNAGLSACGGNRLARLLRNGLMVLSWAVAYALLLNPAWLYHEFSPQFSVVSSNLLRAFSYPGWGNLSQWFPMLMGEIKHPLPNLLWGLGGLALASVLIVAALQQKQLPAAEKAAPIRSAMGLPSKSMVVGVMALALAWRFIFPPAAREHFEFKQDEQRLIVNPLDGNYFGQEGNGNWWRGPAVVSFRLSSDKPLQTVTMSLHSLVANRLRLSLGGGAVSFSLGAGEPLTIRMQPKITIERFGSYYVRGYAQIVRAVKPSSIMTSDDQRELGVFWRYEERSD